MSDELEKNDSQKHRIKEQYRKWKEGDDKKEHISTYYSGMDRLTNFKQNYSKRSGDILMSKNFQRAYGIIVPLIVLGFLGIVLYVLIGLPVNALYHFIWCDTDCTDLPASPGIIIVAILDSLLQQSVTKLPTIYPAIKRGIPVTTAYKLPIRILLKE